MNPPEFCGRLLLTADAMAAAWRAELAELAERDGARAALDADAAAGAGRLPSERDAATRLLVGGAVGREARAEGRLPLGEVRAAPLSVSRARARALILSVLRGCEPSN